jgi:hypothetical protein
MNPIQFLYSALASPYGVVVRTDNPALLRQRLYSERKKSGDPLLMSITIAESRDDPSSELWLMKQGASSAEEK